MKEFGRISSHSNEEPVPRPASTPPAACISSGALRRLFPAAGRSKRDRVRRRAALVQTTLLGGRRTPVETEARKVWPFQPHHTTHACILCACIRASARAYEKDAVQERDRFILAAEREFNTMHSNPLLSKARLVALGNGSRPLAIEAVASSSAGEALAAFRFGLPIASKLDVRDRPRRRPFSPLCACCAFQNVRATTFRSWRSVLGIQTCPPQRTDLPF